MTVSAGVMIRAGSRDSELEGGVLRSECGSLGDGGRLVYSLDVEAPGPQPTETEAAHHASVPPSLVLYFDMSSKLCFRPVELTTPDTGPPLASVNAAFMLSHYVGCCSSLEGTVRAGEGDAKMKRPAMALHPTTGGVQTATILAGEGLAL